MVVENTVHRRTMIEAAEARTIARAAEPHDHDHDHHDQEHDHDHSFEWPEALRVGLVAIAAAVVWFRVWEPFPAISIIGIVGLLIGGWPILKEAFENILERRMTMELSMTIAIVAAAAIGQFFTALVITLFVLVAEVLEGLTVGRGRKAIRDLLEFLPREVSVRRAGSIRVRFGGRAAYRRCHSGRSRRPYPGRRRRCSRVTPSSTNPASPANRCRSRRSLARTSSRAPSTSPARSKSARNASAATPATARSSRRWNAPSARARRCNVSPTGWPDISSTSRSARPRSPYLITRDIVSTISVIIVAGACGIAAGTPLAILGGIGRSARLGRHRQRRRASGNARPGRHGGARQNRHADLRPSRSAAHRFRRGCERGDNPRARQRPSCAPSILLAKPSSPMARGAGPNIGEPRAFSLHAWPGYLHGSGDGAPSWSATQAG